jgi:hypothetical protein
MNRSKQAGMGTKAIVALLVGLTLASVHLAEAQQFGKIPRVGILFIGGRDQPHLQSFKQGLHERGYEEGKNIKLEYKYAEGKKSGLTNSPPSSCARKSMSSLPPRRSARWRRAKRRKQFPSS